MSLVGCASDGLAAAKSGNPEARLWVSTCCGRVVRVRHATVGSSQSGHPLRHGKISGGKLLRTQYSRWPGSLFRARMGVWVRVCGMVAAGKTPYGGGSQGKSGRLQ